MGPDDAQRGRWCRAREKNPPELLTESQAWAFLEAAKERSLIAFYVTATMTGMRKAGILRFWRVGVNLEAGIIQINQISQSVSQKGTILSEPKTEKPPRSINLPTITVEALR